MAGFLDNFIGRGIKDIAITLAQKGLLPGSGLQSKLTSRQLTELKSGAQRTIDDDTELATRLKNVTRLLEKIYGNPEAIEIGKDEQLAWKVAVITPQGDVYYSRGALATGEQYNKEKIDAITKGNLDVPKELNDKRSGIVNTSTLHFQYYIQKFVPLNKGS